VGEKVKEERLSFSYNTAYICSNLYIDSVPIIALLGSD
jgi:hypothetical protein